MEWKRRLTMVGIAVGVYVGYAYLLPAAVPFLAAWILAVWLHPAVVTLHKKIRIKKGLAAALLLGLLFGVAGVVLFWGFGELLSQLGTALQNLPDWLHLGAGFLERICVRLEENFGIARQDSYGYLHALGMSVREEMPALAALFFRKLQGWANGGILFLSGLGVTFILTVLILGDFEKLQKKIWDYSWLVGTRRVIKRLQRTTVVYVKSQAVIMVLVGVVSSVWFWLMKSPYFLIQGIALGFLDALPLLGTGSFLYPAAVYYLLRGQPGTALGCVLLDVVTSFVREFLEPRLLGGRLGISPIAVIASVYLGFFLFGGWGVILGPLSFSTAYEIGREWDVWD